MTSKLDRIQENANEYIVKNCPCYALKGGYYDCWANQDTWCENITDCVIKQVIEIAKDIIEKDKNNLYDYSDFGFMPKWMFDGLRVEEGKYLDRIGIIPKETFIEYLKNNQLNPDMYLPKEEK